MYKLAKSFVSLLLVTTSPFISLASKNFKKWQFLSRLLLYVHASAMHDFKTLP
jgi:hypothetical protein